MQKLYSLCKKRLQPLFCATAGILYMTMLTAQPVFAEDVATGGENIWSRFSTIMQVPPVSMPRMYWLRIPHPCCSKAQARMI